MSRKQLKRTTGGMAKYVIVGFFILVVACGVGFTAASAESSDEIADASAFGFDEATQAATTRQADKTSEAEVIAVHQAAFAEDAKIIKQESYRSLDAGFQMIDEAEERERRRIAEEIAQAQNRVATQKAKQGVVNASASTTNDADEYGLPAVDWSMSKDKFIQEWTRRIDAYLEGSNLAGYGSVFAETAWEKGVDPRWSPAISNTESSKGGVCFLPCNAWGWGSRSWSNWTAAIRDHISGLAEGYGYSITKEAAYAYCPPTYLHWYDVTIRQMALI